MKTLIRGGRIVDGTGAPPYRADILIEGETIREIGQVDASLAQEIMEAEGLMVSPGFIDGHTHSELSLMENRQHPNAVYQGISTVVTGQCGLGFAPMQPSQFDDSIRLNAGLFGDRRATLPRWDSFAAYLRLLNGCAVNAASNVSHNAVRQMALGFSDAPLTGEALTLAQNVLDQALSEGGAGFSVGLSYCPGAFSDTQELIELCRVVKKHDALFCVHLRLPEAVSHIDPLGEIVRVVRETGVRVNILHYKTGGMEDAQTLLAPFQPLIDEGFDIHFEYYPYLVGAGMVLPFLPSWMQVGGYEAMMSRLRDRSLRQRLLAEMEPLSEIFFPHDTTGRINLLEDPEDPNLGKTFREVAQERGETVNETLLQLLEENHLAVGFFGIETQDAELARKLYDDQQKLFEHPLYSIGSDAIPYGPLPHPRAYGTFPRVIRQMRERGLPVEKILPKFTSLPAKLYRLRDRGVLAVNHKADICLFDFDRVQDTATFHVPQSRPEGIHTLLVNGKTVLRDGTITGVLSGRALEADK